MKLTKIETNLIQEISKRATSTIYLESYRWKEGSRCLKDRMPDNGDYEDCVSEGTKAILEGLKEREYLISHEGYMYLCARRGILKYLFRNRLKMQGILEKRKYSFIENEQRRIYEFLLSIRKKKGNRGIRATIQDMQILLFVSNGWRNKQIAEELKLPELHVKDYRKRIRKKLTDYLNQNK